MDNRGTEPTPAAPKSNERIQHERLQERIALLKSWIEDAGTQEEKDTYAITLSRLEDEDEALKRLLGDVTDAPHDAQSLTDADGVPIWEKV